MDLIQLYRSWLQCRADSRELDALGPEGLRSWRVTSLSPRRCLVAGRALAPARLPSCLGSCVPWGSIQPA